MVKMSPESGEDFCIMVCIIWTVFGFYHCKMSGGSTLLSSGILSTLARVWGGGGLNWIVLYLGSQHGSSDSALPAVACFLFSEPETAVPEEHLQVGVSARVGASEDRQCSCRSFQHQGQPVRTSGGPTEVLASERVYKLGQELGGLKIVHLVFDLSS